MFFVSPESADPDSRELRALRRSLNTPVIAVEGLPVGPASAAIALHAGPPDRPRVTIAVRSLRGESVCFYTASEALTDLNSQDLALDAALSFAEGMGFLFDDDEVAAGGDAGPQQAARAWRELLDADPPPLEDVVAGGEPERGADVAAATAPAPLLLSKFRRSSGRAQGPGGQIA